MKKYLLIACAFLPVRVIPNDVAITLVALNKVLKENVLSLVPFLEKSISIKV